MSAPEWLKRDLTCIVSALPPFGIFALVYYWQGFEFAVVSAVFSIWLARAYDAYDRRKDFYRGVRDAAAERVNE